MVGIADQSQKQDGRADGVDDGEQGAEGERDKFENKEKSVHDRPAKFFR
jgi:hypothetical protein